MPAEISEEAADRGAEWVKLVVEIDWVERGQQIQGQHLCRMEARSNDVLGGLEVIVLGWDEGSM